MWPSQKYEEDLIEYFGDPGENQVRIQTPYPLIVAWGEPKIIHSFLCHELIKDSLHKVLTKVLDHYGAKMVNDLRLDVWGGCLNVRPMTGNPDRLSLHAWGVAIDWDPTNNLYKFNHKKAQLARPEYETWWEIWESEGWTSLGREIDKDWMHVQAARM